MKNLKVCWPLLVMLSVFATTVSAQKKNKKAIRDSIQAAGIEKLLTSQKYVFTAEFASAAQGGSTTLTSYFYLEVNPEAVNCILPYYGNSYNSGGISDSKIKLTSKNFDYLADKSIPGHWYVSIKPKDSTTEKELLLDIAVDGSASLAVISNNRSRMTYTGTIEAKVDRTTFN
ncbi:DUF4251 domain-containing protein [Mucilaginibacter terrae]|uniref:DUF4251 domain-containing protein n=1 Tax=Mucilaginibacter terrae TaxID=1955052 RepID=A0ABU3GRQ2_9SPHI|nr:DUF4251 domain-containing protein [Mucilaginibacter terrae]MDT3402454.1 hypothetical protein [Mucilaginibacter terrae]